MLENGQAAVVRQVLVQANAGTALAQDARQCRLADLDGLAPQVRPVQLQQIEGVEEGGRLVATPAEDIEPGESALIAAAHLAIDQDRAHLKMVHGLHHQRETRRPVGPIAG